MPKIYVGNLASSVTSRDLLEHFSRVSRAGGALSALAVTDRVSGLCRGFGFVEMAEISDVTVALGLLNNSELNGCRIRIEPEPALRNGKARKRVKSDAGDCSYPPIRNINVIGRAPSWV